MGLLLAIIVAGSVSAVFYVTSMNDIIRQTVYVTTADLKPIDELQRLIFESAIPVHQYLIYGHHEERDNFIQLRQKVERAFLNTITISSTLEQRELLVRALEEWHQIVAQNESAFFRDPTTTPYTEVEMELLHRSVNIINNLLNRLYNLGLEQIYEQEREALDNAANMVTTRIIGSSIIIAFAVIATLLLIYSVLTPIRLLKEGTAHFARGNLSHRVPVVSNDELGELAKAFNSMAENLERSEAALKEMATRDGLTGLYNSREFHRLLQAEIERSQRYKHPVSLLIGDIDRFKKVNDTYGHQAGDVVLRAVADHMQSSVRKVDYVARYGGEEFAIILPEMTAADATVIAERIRENIATTAITIAAPQRVSVAISIGVAAFPENANSENTLIAAADQALYAAKAAGRNRVCRAS